MTTPDPLAAIRLQAILEADDPCQAARDYLRAVEDRQRPGTHDAVEAAVALISEAACRIEQAEAGEQYEQAQRHREAGMRRALERTQDRSDDTWLDAAYQYELDREERALETGR